MIARSPGRLSVVVVAAYPSVRAGLRELLERAGLEVLTDQGPDRDPTEAPHAVDVVVVDTAGLDPADLVDPGFVPGAPVVWLVDRLPGAVRRAGASPGAWLPRDAGGEQIAAAARAASAGMIAVDTALLEERDEAVDAAGGHGHERLTDRELEVLRLVAAGQPNKAIARELGISEHTVKFHVGAVLSKLNARSRAEAVALATTRGWLPL